MGKAGGKGEQQVETGRVKGEQRARCAQCSKLLPNTEGHHAEGMLHRSRHQEACPSLLRGFVLLANRETSA